MKLSVIIPIRNRSQLFDIGLNSLAKQFKDWELVLVDEMSSEDLSKVYKQYPIKVTHIKFSPEGHPYNNGYHTPALAINLCIKHAKGVVICITQPEIIHDVENLQRGYEQAKQDEFVFGKVILSHLKSKFTKEMTFNECWQEATRLAVPFADNALYWYVAFVKKEHIEAIRGVEEWYMGGVYAEDDDFKERLRLHGVLPVLNSAIRGVHINHEHEGDLYTRQDRNGEFWKRGAERNRKRFYDWLETRKKGDRTVNKSGWGEEKYIKEITYIR